MGRILGKQVWCVCCADKRPPVIRKSDQLVPARKKHYDLLPDQSAVDMRVFGVCDDCLLLFNEFQQNNTVPVDFNHKYLIFKKV